MPSAPTRERVTEELRNNLQIGLGAGLIGGGLLGFLAAAATLAANPVLLRSAGDVLRVLLGLQFVYAALCLVLGFVGAFLKTLLSRLSGRRISDTKTAAIIAGVGFFFLGAAYAWSWARWHRLGGLTPDAPPGVGQIPIMLAVLVTAALLARVMAYAFYVIIVYVKKPAERRPGDLKRVGYVLLYMAAFFTLSVITVRFTARPEPAESGLTAEAIQPTGRRVALIGLEGMDQADVSFLRRQGRLPWASAFRDGEMTPVVLPSEPVPPIVWSAVATGRDPTTHADLGYQTQVVKGLSVPLRIQPRQVGLFQLFHTVLPFFHMTRSVPVKSYMRESKALWSMASDCGLRSAAVNWWVSWPAERIRGEVVTDHAWLKLAGPPGPAASAESASSWSAAEQSANVQVIGEGSIGARSPLRPDGLPLLLERETWPPTLLIELAHLAGPEPADSVRALYGPPPPTAALETFTRLGIPHDVLRSDLFYAQAAAWLTDRSRPDLALLHLPGPDVLRRVLLRGIPDPVARERARSEALTAYWETLDPAVGAFLRAAADNEDIPTADRSAGEPGEADPRGTDDHPPPLAGWLCLPGVHWPGQDREERGFFALTSANAVAGDEPGSPRRSAVAAIKPEDVAPTLLWLLGLPVSREMDGVPRTGFLAADSGARTTEVRVIGTYGRPEPEDLHEVAGTLDQEMLERFRSLGYLR